MLLFDTFIGIRIMFPTVIHCFCCIMMFNMHQHAKDTHDVIIVLVLFPIYIHIPRTHTMCWVRNIVIFMCIVMGNKSFPIFFPTVKIWIGIKRCLIPGKKGTGWGCQKRTSWEGGACRANDGVQVKESFYEGRCGGSKSLGRCMGNKTKTITYTHTMDAHDVMDSG